MPSATGSSGSPLRVLSTWMPAASAAARSSLTTAGCTAIRMMPSASWAIAWLMPSLYRLVEFWPSNTVMSTPAASPAASTPSDISVENWFWLLVMYQMLLPARAVRSRAASGATSSLGSRAASTSGATAATQSAFAPSTGAAELSPPVELTAGVQPARANTSTPIPTTAAVDFLMIPPAVRASW